MNTIQERQPALISTDANDAPVVITVAELRWIARGLHEATDEQVQGLARFALDRVDE